MYPIYGNTFAFGSVVHFFDLKLGGKIYSI